MLRVRRAELGRTLRLSSLAIVLGCGMYTAFNGTQAIFLTRTGPQAYPAFFIVLALTVWPAIAAQAAANRRWGVAAAFRRDLLLNAFLPIPVFAAYSIAENYLVSFLALVLYSVAFEILMLQFWSFVSQYFNILEAKRVYPVIAAGSGLGYIFAGAVTTLVVERTGRPELLVFGWALGAAGAGLIAYRASRRLHRPAAGDEADPFLDEQLESVPVGTLESVREAFRYLRVSRLVLALVLLGTVLLVGMRISDYLVALVFVRSTPDLTALTILLGNAWMLSYVVQLALGLWVTPWLLSRAGVKNAILALPVATLAGFAAVALAPGLATALFLFVVRNGLQTGVDDPARNVLDGALPEQVQPRLAVLQDNLVLPGSAALTGVVLIVVGFFFGSASVLFLAWVGIVVSLALLAGALWVRSLYLSAVFQRLRSHTLSLADLELAIGQPSPEEVEELKGHVASDDPEVRRFAAAALGTLAEDTFRQLAPELVLSADPELRRLAFQLSPPGVLGAGLIDLGARDPDPWVAAAAAVSGSAARPPWGHAREVLERLHRSDEAEARAAAVWAAAYLADERLVAEGLADPQPRVRLEALASFARLRGEVAGAAEDLVPSLGDPDQEVRREALRQAVRWAPPAGQSAAFAEVLVANLASPDPVTQRLAGEAISIQCPAALEGALGLLERETRVAAAALEAIFRCGRADAVARATAHLEGVLEAGVRSAADSRRAAQDQRCALLRIALDDHREQATTVGLAGLRSLHDKRGFSRVERGLRSTDPAAKAVATETLLNFGPARLVEPLARLLDPESFEGGPVRPLSEAEIRQLASHPDEWVRRAAETVRDAAQDSMKELIALKKVPLFANLTLQQLASIDKLMVTRRYLAGEQIFKWGDHSSELYVVLEGEVRIHRDDGDNEVTLARLGPSSFMGEMAPFTEEPRSASAEAVVATVVRVLRKDRLGAILNEHPEVLLEVIKNLSRRLVVANSQLEAAARSLSDLEPVDKAPGDRRRSR